MMNPRLLEIKRESKVITQEADLLAAETQDDISDRRAAEMDFNTQETARIEQKIEENITKMKEKYEKMKILLKKAKSL